MSFPHRLWRSRSRGAGLFQVLLALGVMGVLIVGAVLLYQSVMARNARAELVQLSRELRGGIERAWVGLGDYAGVSRQTLCKYGAVPASVIVWKPTHPKDCDQARYVAPLGDPGSTGNSIGVWALSDNPKMFQVAFKALDSGACQALLGGYVGQTENRSNFVGAATIAAASPPGYGEFKIRGSGFIASNGETGDQLNPARVSALCKRSSGPDASHVWLMFR